MSGRILGTCSNDSDCCFVVLLSFFGWQAFYGFPKMHKNKNSLAVGIDSVYVYISFWSFKYFLSYSGWTKKKHGYRVGPNKKKLPTFWSFISHWGERSRGVLSFKIGSRKIRFIERDESADSEKTSKFGALKTKNNTF